MGGADVGGAGAGSPAEDAHPVHLPSNWWLIGLFGGFGGMAPGLLTLVSGSSIVTATDLAGQVVIGGVMFLLGGVVALVVERRDFRKAFFVGLAAPTFIAPAVHKIESAEAAPTEVHAVVPAGGLGFALPLIASAHAQEAPRSEAAPSPPGQLEMMRDLVRPPPQPFVIDTTIRGGELSVVAISRDGTRQTQVVADGETVDLPEDTAFVGFSAGDFKSKLIPRDSLAEAQTVRVHPENPFMTGAFRALGLKDRGRLGVQVEPMAELGQDSAEPEGRLGTAQQ